MARILIVDDEESIRFTLSRFLTDAGHEARTAKDHDEALAVLADREPDLVFSDIVLGGKTGIQLLREIRERDLHCPVVMITGYPGVETASEAVRLGAFDYIIKPVLQETVLRITDSALRLKSASDEKERYCANLEGILESVKDAIITVDTGLRVIEVNEAAQRLCSLSKNAVGQELPRCGLLCAGRCLPALRAAVESRKATEGLLLECRHTERPLQRVILSVFPLMTSPHGFSGAVMVVREEARLATLEEDLSECHRFGGLIGKSREMQKLYGLIEALKDVRTTVLITGESGTGKELVASALHRMGVRAPKPFVRVNCAALNDNLLASELFGHVKGAFTGAVKDNIGRFQRAQGGTIFLDEIGNISPGMQLSLLRVLQEKEFERVGSSMSVKADVRVIAATNRNLPEKVSRGEFREDLYYRLKVVELHLSPLRERREDVPLLVEHFICKFNRQFERDIAGMSQEALDLLLNHSWPGNVRELEHAIEHAFILCRERTITPADLPADLKEDLELARMEVVASPLKKACSNREAVIGALKKTGGNKAKAARVLGLSERTIYRKIKEYNLPAD